VEFHFKFYYNLFFLALFLFAH